MSTATMASVEQQAAEAFARDVAEHELTVLHDDGLYRHLMLRRPGTSLCRVEIITWPGHLSLGGDRDGYVFRCTNDMFTFFRAKSGWNPGTINPGYWAQKLTTKVPVKLYDEEKCRQVIREYLDDADEDYYPGLKEYARQTLRDADLDGELVDETTARQWLRNFSYVVPAVAPVRSFEFSDVWEWDLTAWDFHYLYACHAIQWGIEQYDRARLAATESALAVIA